MKVFLIWVAIVAHNSDFTLTADNIAHLCTKYGARSCELRKTEVDNEVMPGSKLPPSNNDHWALWGIKQ